MNRLTDERRPVRHIRLSRHTTLLIVAVIGLIPLTLVAWISTLALSVTVMLPAILAADILIALSLVEGAIYLRHLNDRIRSGETTAQAPLEFTVLRWRFYLTLSRRD